MAQTCNPAPERILRALRDLRRRVEAAESALAEANAEIAVVAAVEGGGAAVAMCRKALDEQDSNRVGVFAQIAGSGPVALRIAGDLALEGPVIDLYSVSRSGIEAVHCAARALRSGDCDIALALAIVPERAGVLVLTTARNASPLRPPLAIIEPAAPNARAVFIADGTLANFLASGELTPEPALLLDSQKPAVAPLAVRAHAPLWSRLTGASETERRQALEDWLTALIAASLRAPTDAIDRDAPLTSLGIDSMTAAQIATRARDEMRIDLPPTAAFEFPTIASLAGHLAEAKAVRPARQNVAVLAGVL